MFDYDETPAPSRNESLIKLYDLLISIIGSLTPDITTHELHDGSGERFNGYVDELIKITGDEKLSDFKVIVKPSSRDKDTYMKGEAYVRQLSGIANYLHKSNAIIGYYCSGPPTVKFGKQSAIPMFSNNFQAEQNNTQQTEVHIEFTQTIISLTETLTNLERDYPDESTKENKFAKALKKSLPFVKNGLGIVAVVLKIASELGLDPQRVLKMLRLE